MNYDELINYQEVINKINTICDAVTKNSFLVNFNIEKQKVNKCEKFFNDLEQEKDRVISSFPKIEEYISNMNESYSKYLETIKSVCNSDDVEQLTKSIESEIEKIKQIENKLIEESSKYEKNLQGYAVVEDAYKKSKKFLEENKDQYIDLQNKVKLKLDEYNEEKKKIEKKIPKEQLEKFKNIEKETNGGSKEILKVIKIDDSTAPISCPHCTIDLDNELRKKLNVGELVVCGSCRRLVLGKKN